ncbi:Methyltransferase TYW3 family protein [Theileria parva strain Muguga]|uniref:tRNA(Phe) 7-[(3-amino-3-carboxypropyl)-4-demethylwyosine(37)-N(4)]-methyltransferase n=1 Tax=Theileria parva TaxID=5875 RepID=Q4N5W3_THEPA|nr:Methyltransferase TYW3 family protein [Theileria parva strain Muguga]EAN32460.1 Methyltransferase TYW3 family protein [Theileria parva strain Muguga]|eukprot:XP_764743.1 hypothetical protein [Theileria parva strain Muguga]
MNEMENVRMADEFFGDELLGTIYEETEVYMEKNPSNFKTINGKSITINEIEEPVSNKVYKNLENAVKKLGKYPLKSKLEDSLRNLTEYINSYGYRPENVNYCDKSLKKSIDVLLIPLMRLIVDTGRYVTTSSCSGRIVFFEKDSNFQTKNNPIYGRSGRILYSSHTHIVSESLSKIKESIESNPKNKFNCYKLEQDTDEEETKDDSGPASSEDKPEQIENQVILKFEPFLIHVDCNTLEDAICLLNICRSVGLKQSGLSSSKKKYILAIRGNNILEAPIMYKSYKVEKDKPILLKNQYLISYEYLIHLINTCNVKMSQNFKQFLSLYHKLVRIFKNDQIVVSQHSQPIENYLTVENNHLENDNLFGNNHLDNIFGNNHLDKNVVENMSKISKKDEYIDMMKCMELVGRDLLFGLEGDKRVDIMSFHGECNQLLRTHCCMASSKDYVLVFGGYQKSKSKTICVCDLNKVDQGFKVFEINHGPEALLDSTILSDGTVFITFGGRISGDKASNDVYMLYIYNQGDTQIKWSKCQLMGEKIPVARFRHSVCLEKSDERGSDGDLEYYDSSSNIFRFYMSGGASSCSPLDDNILGDIWRCTVEYKIQENNIINPTVQWDCLYEDKSLGWFSGSMAHSPSDNCLYLIGGCKNLDEFLKPGLKRMDQLVAFNLQNKTVRNQNLLLKNENREFPPLTMSHSLVPLENDDYYIVGGFGSLAFLDEIWYLNLSEKSIKKALMLPKGTRARMGASVISFKYGNCNHEELWIIGGGVPSVLNFGSFYDKPLIIVLNCDGLCEENSENTETNNFTTGDVDKYKILGLYVVVEDKNLVKNLKNKLELLNLFDKSRKIFQFNESDYLYHSVACDKVEDFTECSECKREALCVCCKICSNCCYSTTDSIFFLPIKAIENYPELNPLKKYKVYSCSDLPVRIKQNPRDKLLAMFKDKELETIVRNVEVFGDNLLITPVRGLDFPEIDWESVSKEFKVSSVALVGEIEGEERHRQVELLYGNGDASIRENGVTYIFNIKTNMFSKGNSSERIRIQKMYFSDYRHHRRVREYKFSDELTPYYFLASNNYHPKLKPIHHYELKDLSKYQLEGEIMVDFFCGIGYFTIPILKYTDEKRLSRVLCVDVNETAIKYLMENAKANKIDLSRIEVKVGNCGMFGKSYGFDYVGEADKILLGLLPSSRVGWIPAIAAVNTMHGGIVYVHGLSRKKKGPIIESITTLEDWEEVGEFCYTTKQYEEDKKHDCDCEVFSLYVLRSFHELCRNHPYERYISWKLTVLHVETVKRYSPHKYHQVVDLKITPVPS